MEPLLFVATSFGFPMNNASDERNDSDYSSGLNLNNGYIMGPKAERDIGP